MKSSILLLIVHVLQVLSCDLTRHYINDKGECCDMCGPGTRMPSMAKCRDPTCTPCKEGEYQDRYTKDVTCIRHPYCDPNLHLESAEPITKDHISVCKCMSGHHCINDRCTTCNPNTPCKPGYMVSENATQMTDTKCVECPPGTFSAGAFESTCQEWTNCINVREEGTTTTDRLCGDAEKSHHVGLYIVLAIVLGIVICIICFWLRGRFGVLWGAQDNCADIWKRKFQKKDIEAALDEPLHRQVAEENEVKDDTAQAPVQEGDSRFENQIDTEVRSEGGQPIQQEHGKEDVLSQTESCECT